MTIQQATEEHLEEVAILFDAYRVFYHKISDLDGAISFLKARMENQESIIYLARDEEGERAGFVQLYPLFSSTRMRRLWLLNDLFVEPSQRGKGIGIGLIDAAKELCRKTDACGLILETTKDNTIGNQLYPRTGFELDQDHNYYSWDNE